MFTTKTSRTLLATGALAAVLLTGACAGGSDGQDAAGSAAEPALAETDASAGGARSGALRESPADADQAEAESAADTGSDTGADSLDEEKRAVIATGTVSLEAEDVLDARDEVQQVVDTHQGTISHEESRTSDDGELDRTRLVLRIPVANVEAAVADLKQVATLESSNYGEEDVTTEVKDVDARIRAQETSVRRIEALLAEAEDLGTLLRIEQELTRRQGELDSLKSRQKWLANQTDHATITVHLERTEEPEEDDTDRAGFLGGLQDGWDSFVAALGGAALVIGFLLPWLGLALAIGALLWVLVRLTRRAPKVAATAE